MRPSSGSILKASLTDSPRLRGDQLRSRSMIGQRVAAALPLAVIPGIESGAWDAKLVQRVLGQKCHCSTSWMISVCLGRRRSHASFSPSLFTFLERPVLQRKVGHHFFQRRRLTTQILHRTRSCHTRRIAARRCLSVPRKSLDPPCTLRRQYLGRLSSKDILVALQSLLDGSIFSADGYSGMFWRRMSFGTPSGGTCPVRISVSSMLLVATMNQKSLIGQTVNLSQTL